MYRCDAGPNGEDLVVYNAVKEIRGILFCFGSRSLCQLSQIRHCTFSSVAQFQCDPDLGQMHRGIEEWSAVGLLVVHFAHVGYCVIL